MAFEAERISERSRVSCGMDGWEGRTIRCQDGPGQGKRVVSERIVDERAPAECKWHHQRGEIGSGCCRTVAKDVRKRARNEDLESVVRKLGV